MFITRLIPELITADIFAICAKTLGNVKLPRFQSVEKVQQRLGCFGLPAAKATTSYASGKGELIARKEVDKIKTPY